ncbi:Crp/Fnr family transcriptional regulator [Sinanaerobacter sp. ZZT-01]|uniref:Crp/Fnr family transcriptional regulator n=1 Tax=Sinanaerobacter sp. ZZT-01 TaxID=3111540 RepID=UPI002D78D2E3|nr:Crp/Fnr family transcriptional regulator [Sinanaerobacter sp. ZZT-01]WRR93759.1 Crp/Fnr family transcriptional regulator [Sinanaerobacter sp. ZZT-01]
MNKAKTDGVWNELLLRYRVSLDAVNLDILMSIFHQKMMKKNEFFIREGEKSTEIGLIIKGVFRSFYIDEQGNEITKYFHAEGDLLFSYLAYLSQKESTYYLQALEDSEILVTSVADFEKIMEGNYQLLLFNKKITESALVMKEEHAISFKLWDSMERYNNFSICFPGLEQRIKQCDLASYLGITPVSLSRLKAKRLNK